MQQHFILLKNCVLRELSVRSRSMVRADDVYGQVAHTTLTL